MQQKPKTKKKVNELGANKQAALDVEHLESLVCHRKANLLCLVENVEYSTGNVLDVKKKRVSI